MQRSPSLMIALALVLSFAGACSSGDDSTDVGTDTDVPHDVPDVGDDGDVATTPCTPGSDPDNDGISTTDEGGETADADGDTTPNYLDVDSDGDTVPDAEEGGRTDCSTPRDRDGDTVRDFLDTDSDNNGVLDGDEPAGDMDGDTTPDRGDSDDDGDNIPDATELGTDATHPRDSDGDTTPDYRDLDSDGDTIRDHVETAIDADSDTIPDYLDLDTDGDTIPDATEGLTDTDGDGRSNFRDLDSDNDGLPDSEESGLRGTDPLDTDSDDDGFDDLSEVALGTDPMDGDSIPPLDTFYFTLPYEDPEQTQDFDFQTTLIMADIFFLIDTTNSMAGEITNLLLGLTDTVIPGILASIPEPALGLARFEDFPMSPYGEAGNRVYELEQQMTTDYARVYDAIAGLSVFRGGDIPESDIPALYAAASGEAIGYYSAPFISDPTTPGTGSIGGAGFRADSQPIFVLVTDAAFHNDVSGTDPYNPTTLGATTPNITYPQALAALLTISARVIGVASPGGRTDLEDIAMDTGTIDGAGAPIVFDVDADGTGLSTGLVGAIAELASGTPQDVDTFLEDDPSDSQDATLFITSVRTVSPDPPAGVTERREFDFLGVIPGTIVTFRVTAVNNIVPAGPTSQVFKCVLVVRGNGVARLDEHDVIILVPAEGAGGPFG